MSSSTSLRSRALHDVKVASYPRTSGVHVRRGDDQVLAAGGLCWREGAKGLEVLLIHRPRYKDWSWPKGKIDAEETIPECAVREIQEEVGLDVRLGLPLPSIHYSVKAGKKSVYYWAVFAGDQTPTPDGDEVDEARWVSADKARSLITHPSDIPPLDYLEAAYRDDALATLPLIITRHAKAKPRSKWTQEEGERPLAPSGFRQAKALAQLVKCWKPERVISSPWKRCVQTMQPYVNAAKPKVKLVDAFTESAAKDHPSRTRKRLAKLLTSKHVSVYCGHRPVMPLVLDVLSRACLGDCSQELPTKDPYLRPGAALIAHLSQKRAGRIVAIEVHEPFDD